MTPSLLSQDPVPCNNMIGVTPTWEWRRSLQKDENRALKLQLGEKISEKGANIVKIGFLSASVRMQARVCIRRLDHAFV